MASALDCGVSPKGSSEDNASTFSNKANKLAGKYPIKAKNNSTVDCSAENGHSGGKPDHQAQYHIAKSDSSLSIYTFRPFNVQSMACP